ncbi:MAG: sigma-54-dependent Fis family transcriptional regulator [Gammaproteobacteria bacterium]|nr:sigma-54-dependent Fis family transcriptional regulator [Gammaproteobacteria bacterium]
MSGEHILIVDDEPDICALLREILEDEGYQVSVAENADAARQARRQRKPDLVLLDIWMPGTDGISLLKEWSDGNRVAIPVIMMSGHGSVETAVEATRLGAFDFIEKPLSMAKLLVTVRRALENQLLHREYRALRSHVPAVEQPLGNSTAMQRVRDQARRIAEHRTPVFIEGESGTGKEVVARFLHQNSARAAGPFISIGVASLARENPDIALFGAEDGAQISYGSLEQANGGSLFLKDIADLDLSSQARLLGVLENSGFQRVGGREQITVDVRIIAATRQDLVARIQAGTFRDDLYYQLNIVPIRIPPLRERREDIAPLTDFYLRHFAEHDGLPARSISPDARTAIASYDWPGNVRELTNFIQRLLILGAGDTITVDEVQGALGTKRSLADSAGHPEFEQSLRDARHQFEKAYLEYQFGKLGGSVAKVAERAGIERTHLYRKLRSLGLDPKLIAR